MRLIYAVSVIIIVLAAILVIHFLLSQPITVSNSKSQIVYQSDNGFIENFNYTVTIPAYQSRCPPDDSAMLCFYLDGVTRNISPITFPYNGYVLITAVPQNYTDQLTLKSNNYSSVAYYDGSGASASLGEELSESDSICSPQIFPINEGTYYLAIYNQSFNETTSLSANVKYFAYNGNYSKATRNYTTELSNGNSSSLSMNLSQNGYVVINYSVVGINGTNLDSYVTNENVSIYLFNQNSAVTKDCQWYSLHGNYYISETNQIILPVFAGNLSIVLMEQAVNVEVPIQPVQVTLNLSYFSQR